MNVLKTRNTAQSIMDVVLNPSNNSSMIVIYIYNVSNVQKKLKGRKLFMRAKSRAKATSAFYITLTVIILSFSYTSYLESD